MSSSAGALLPASAQDRPASSPAPELTEPPWLLRREVGAPAAGLLRRATSLRPVACAGCCARAPRDLLRRPCSRLRSRSLRSSSGSSFRITPPRRRSSAPRTPCQCSGGGRIHAWARHERRPGTRTLLPAGSTGECVAPSTTSRGRSRGRHCPRAWAGLPRARREMACGRAPSSSIAPPSLPPAGATRTVPDGSRTSLVTVAGPGAPARAPPQPRQPPPEEEEEEKFIRIPLVRQRWLSCEIICSCQQTRAHPP